MNAVLSPPREMLSISGVLVHAQPAQLERVKQRLRALPGVEIHADSPEGKLVVTIEELTENINGAGIMRLSEIEGVLSASLIYHQLENNEAAEQEACHETDQA